MRTTRSSTSTSLCWWGALVSEPCVSVFCFSFVVWRLFTKLALCFCQTIAEVIDDDVFRREIVRVAINNQFIGTQDRIFEPRTVSEFFWGYVDELSSNLGLDDTYGIFYGVSRKQFDKIVVNQQGLIQDLVRVPNRTENWEGGLMRLPQSLLWANSFEPIFRDKLHNSIIFTQPQNSAKQCKQKQTFFAKQSHVRTLSLRSSVFPSTIPWTFVSASIPEDSRKYIVPNCGEYHAKQCW